MCQPSANSAIDPENHPTTISPTIMVAVSATTNQVRPRNSTHRRKYCFGRPSIPGARATWREAMHHPLTLLALGTVLLSQAARADALDWKKVDAALGKTATVSGEVHLYGLPRSDLRVTLDGVAIKPALALGGWIAFAPMQGEAMLMGDL